MGSIRARLRAALTVGGRRDADYTLGYIDGLDAAQQILVGRVPHFPDAARGTADERSVATMRATVQASVADLLRRALR